MYDFCMFGRGLCVWWFIVNIIIGRDIEFQLISLVIYLDIINKYFCSIIFDFEYIVFVLIDIFNGVRIFKIFFQVVMSFFFRFKRIVSGLDEFLYWFFRDFVYDFVFVIIDVFNSLL